MKTVAFGIMIFAVGTAAEAAPLAWNNSVPERTFTFAGQSIHPACVDSMEAHEGEVVNLADCTAEGRKDYRKIERKDDTFTAEGRERAILRTPFSSYRVLANRGSTYLLEITWSGGGSGIFDSLQLIKLRAKTLTYQRFIAGGDRCNGGLSETKVTGNKLSYSSNITPYYVIAEPTTTLPAPFDGLDSSAISCVATADTEYDLTSGVSRRVSVSFKGDWYTNGGRPEPLDTDTSLPQVQQCFNALYNSYLQNAHTVLGPAELATFRAAFYKSCKK